VRCLTRRVCLLWFEAFFCWSADIKSQILDLYDIKEPAAATAKAAPAVDAPASQDGPPQVLLEEDVPQVLVKEATVAVVEGASADTGVKEGKLALANGDLCRTALGNGTASRKRKADASIFQDAPAMKAVRSGNC
jgi:hypothetical protein